MAHADVSTVGVIINPHAGKDIRRLVSAAGQTSDAVKIGIVRRVVVGALEQGAERMLLSSDTHQLAERAVEGIDGPIEFVESPLTGSHLDTIAAARSMWKEQAGAIVALGGDGTCRDVATGWPDAPLIADLDGHEQRVSDCARWHDRRSRCRARGDRRHRHRRREPRQAKRVALRIDDPARDTVHHDTALVEAALIETAFVGAGAVNDPSDDPLGGRCDRRARQHRRREHRRAGASDRPSSRRRCADPAGPRRPAGSCAAGSRHLRHRRRAVGRGRSRSVNLSRCPAAECWPTTVNARPRSARMQRSRCRSRRPVHG